jgi:hypothetical protein
MASIDSFRRLLIVFLLSALGAIIAGVAIAVIKTHF